MGYSGAATLRAAISVGNALIVVGCGARSGLIDDRLGASFPDAGVMLSPPTSGTGSAGNRRPKHPPPTRDASIPSEAGHDAGGGASSDASEGGPDSGVDASTCAMPLDRCGPTTPCCLSGSTCVECGDEGLCTVPGRDTCACGAFSDPCDLAGTSCLLPPCDAQGVCVTPSELRQVCTRQTNGSSAPLSCFRCPLCGDNLCVDPPAAECTDSGTVRTFTSTWTGCDVESKCLFAYSDAPCPTGTRCVNGACVGGCDACPAGTVCCDLSSCSTTEKTACVPDPGGCVDPVTAIGCDGRVYSDACAALAAGVCPNTCRGVPFRILAQNCAMTNGNGWFFVETSEALTQLLSNCSASAPSVDFSKEHVIVACYDCACQGVVSISQLRECEGSVVLDYSYAEVCAECDGCLTRCAAVAVSKDVQNVTANFASIPPTCP